jgi:hypothetical protein
MIKQMTFNPVDPNGKTPHWFAHATITETYGGQAVNVNLDQDLAKDLIWLRQHKQRMELEAKAREENESVRSAYEQYQTVLNLVLDLA